MTILIAFLVVVLVLVGAYAIGEDLTEVWNEWQDSHEESE